MIVLGDLSFRTFVELQGVLIRNQTLLKAGQLALKQGKYKIPVDGNQVIAGAHKAGALKLFGMDGVWTWSVTPLFKHKVQNVFILKESGSYYGVCALIEEVLFTVARSLEKGDAFETRDYILRKLSCSTC